MNFALFDFCHWKTAIHNHLYSLNSLEPCLDRICLRANDIQKECAKTLISNNSWLRKLFDYHFKCEYGIHCSHYNSELNTIKQRSRTMCEKLVLAKIVDSTEVKRLVPYVSYTFTNAARYMVKNERT